MGHPVYIVLHTAYFQYFQRSYYIKFCVNPGHGLIIFLCIIKETESLYLNIKLFDLFHFETARLLTNQTLYAKSMNNEIHEVKVQLFSFLFTKK